MYGNGKRPTASAASEPPAIACPFCGDRAPAPLGRVGSQLNWYTCHACHKTWCVRVASPDDWPDGAGALALVVDDEELIRDQLAEILEGFNYRVVLACDGPDALAQVARYGDRLRLVTSDFSMPSTDGLDLARALRRLLVPDATLVVVSGRIDDDEIRTLLQIGVTDVLRKPFDRHSLARAIARGRSEDRTTPE